MPIDTFTPWSSRWSVRPRRLRVGACCLLASHRFFSSPAQFPHMNSFPGERSVLVHDNCPIHHQERILDAATARGIIVLFLVPYDPDSMPVEFAYKCMKNWMRKNGKYLTDMGVSLERQLRMAMHSVGRGESRHAFHAARYI